MSESKYSPNGKNVPGGFLPFRNSPRVVWVRIEPAYPVS